MDHVGIEGKIAIPDPLPAADAPVRAGFQVVRAGPIFLAVMDAVIGLPVLRVPLAGDGVGDAGSGHEIALVRGVDEHFRDERPSVVRA